MYKKIKSAKFKRGFTLIELIVVMAVIAVLVLLAVPRFMGQTEKAKAAQMQNDIRAAETKVAEWLATEDDVIDKKNYEPVASLVDKELKPIDGGIEVTNITEDIVDEIGTSLTGEFYSDRDGRVYYLNGQPVADDGSGEDKKPELSHEEWLESLPEEYVLATDDDFSGETNGKFRYIGTDEYVEIPHVIKGVSVTSYARMFQNTSVKGVKSTNKNVTDIGSMFTRSKATSIDLSSLDTSSVTNMTGMFYESQATSLDLSSFDTSNVTNMSLMFFSSQATSIDLSSFDTSSVTDMNSMFYYSLATNLDLSSFDTSNVTNMNLMFSNSKVTSLDLSSFDTSSVWNMMSMFQNSKVTSLDLSSFDTSNVGYMTRMFENSKVTSLDLSSFDTSKVTRMANVKDMFSGSQATIGYARTQADTDKFNRSSNKPVGLTFAVK